MKVIRFLENRAALSKETTRESSSQEQGFLNLLRPLMTDSLPLKKNVLTSLVKSILLSLGLTVEVSATDEAIQKKVFGLQMTTLIFSQWIFRWYQEDSIVSRGCCFVDKGVSETIKNEAKE